MCEHECVCVKVCVCVCVYIYIYIDTHSGWPVSLHVRQLQQNVVTSKSMWPKKFFFCFFPTPHQPQREQYARSFDNARICLVILLVFPL